MMGGFLWAEKNSYINVLDPAIGLTTDFVICVGSVGEVCTLEGFRYVPGSR
jgi:hypothetical protein